MKTFPIYVLVPPEGFDNSSRVRLEDGHNRVNRESRAAFAVETLFGEAGFREINYTPEITGLTTDDMIFPTIDTVLERDDDNDA